MALQALLRHAAQLGSSAPSTCLRLGALSGQQLSGFATDAGTTAKEVVQMMGNRDDPEVDATIKSYLRSLYNNPAKAPEKMEEPLELTSQVEHKYTAAQTVEYGIQNIAVPLSYDTEKTAAPLKRYVAQLLKVSADAGFEAPMAEVSKKLSDKVQTAESVKEFLMRCEPYMSPDFYAALSEALVAVEAKIGGSVMFGANPGYKAFTDQVKEVAKRSGINWQLLAAAGAPPKDAAAAAAVARDLHAYAQSAMVADAKADVDALRAEATALLDKHLSKTADQVRKEQSAAMAAMMKKLEASKGAKWAEQFAKDLKYVSWYDGAVAANPTAGPKAATA